MDRLEPLQPIENDYYLGVAVRDVGPDSEEEMSSDDELQKELKKIAGISTECEKKKGKRQRKKSDFESDMEEELDRGMSEYANEHMTNNMQKNLQIELPKVEEDIPDLEPANDEDMECDESKPSTSLTTSPLKSCLKRKSPLKKSKAEPKTDDGSDNNDDVDDDDEENPIRKMAKDRKKAIDDEPPEFYDTDEDDDNERWVQQKNVERKGGSKSELSSSGLTKKRASAKIDDGSDAVLSCPGCMLMLTRDCQRHEIYKDQYRAMFVENCIVDAEENLKIEKTGKEKKREREKLRKMGFATDKINSTDLFHPVKCVRCGTKVAVCDQDEVYHFFNVLAGYS